MSRLLRLAGCTPFLMWVGGKGGLLDQLIPLLPPGMDHRRHVEPFLGGGALFFRLAPRRAVVGDLNASLVATYEAVRDSYASLVPVLEALARRHARNPSATFYETRDRFNGIGVPPVGHEREAWFIYLNRTCFNGLYRVNASGAFNAPMGDDPNPRIADRVGLRKASAILSGCEVVQGSFLATTANVERGDFVYLDPPYVPVSATSAFVGYTADGFGYAEQVALRDRVIELDRRGARVMVSNSETPLVRELYAGLRLTRVHRRSGIHTAVTDGAPRGPVAELVIRNY